MSYLEKRIRKVIEMQAAVHQCTATVDFLEEKMRPYPPTINNESMHQHVKMVGESLLGKSNVVLSPMLMGAEDFGFYAQKIAAGGCHVLYRNKR